jgi:hypothetical protein
MDEAVSEEGEDVAIGLGLRGIRLRETSTQSSIGSEETESTSSDEETIRLREGGIPIPSALDPATTTSTVQAQSLPPETKRPWTPASRASAPTPASRVEEDVEPDEEMDDTVPNTLLDICKSRIDSSGNGALYPGSIFKGTQTSGRSAYEVEVKIVVST